jgi:hypothetical protein
MKTKVLKAISDLGVKAPLEMISAIGDKIGYAEAPTWRANYHSSMSKFVGYASVSMPLS